MRTFKLGVIEGGARDGGDIFAVLDAKPKVTFRQILDGIEVVHKDDYDKLLAEVKKLKKRKKKLSN